MSTKAMTVREQLDSFHDYAMQRLADGGTELSIDELYWDWRAANPTPEEFAANVAAIQVAIDDMNRGDKGRDAGEIVRELREKYNLSVPD